MNTLIQVNKIANKTYTNFSHYIWGILGAIGISIVFYFIQVLGMQDWYAPLEFSRDKWYFVAPLIIGFGIQAGLFKAIHNKTKGSGKVVAASGGVSASAMVACCMHNLVTFLPFLGISGLAIFLAAYQDYIFAFSVFSVALGVIYMFNKYKETVQCSHLT